MRRSASEIINNLEIRIANLEKYSSRTLKVHKIVIENEDDRVSYDEHEEMTLRELLEELKDLDNVFTNFNGEEFNFEGYGDYSGDVYKYYIKPSDLLHALVGVYFKEVL